MMPSFFNADMVGVPDHHASGGGYTVDSILNELSRQLIGNTRRYSRASNGQQRAGNSMRISKPGSASNSPRASTLQSRRRTLIGNGFQGRIQTRSPAMGQPYLPTPASETPSESFYERETRPARPLSWHPSSQQTHQSLFPLQDTSGNTVLYPFPAYSDADMLAGLQHFPPSPVVYSGYASPAEPFPPLSPAYSSLEVPQMCSPATQSVRVPPQQQQLQQQPALFPPLACSNCSSSSTALETPYLPRPRAAQDSPSWDAYPSSCGNALLARSTAPPTPEDFACSLFPDQSLAGTRGGRQLQQQQQDTTTTRGSAAGTQPPPAPLPPSYQPLIHDDENDDESEGEILYGMGLYDAPDHSKTPSLHQSVVLSLLGGARDQEPDTGKGLGLKLEDAWEPPASEDEEEGAEEDGQGQEEEHSE